MNTYLKDGRLQHEKNDCSVISLSYACDLDYSVAHALCKKAGRIDGHGFSLRDVFAKSDGRRIRENDFAKVTLADKKFVISMYPRPKMTVGRFKETHPVGTFIIRVGGHIFCQKDGIIIFNQGNMRDIISYYYRIVKVK